MMNSFSKKQLLETAELVLNNLAHQEKKSFGDDVDPWRGFAARDFGIEVWDWPQGVGLYGMEKLQSYYGDNRYDSFFEEWLRNNIEEGLPSANINTTAPYNMLLSLAARSGSEEYKKMCRERADWLMAGLPRTKEHGFQHVTTDLHNKNGVILNENQLWVDTLVMAVLFTARMGVAEQNQEWIDEAVYQILLHIKYLYDRKKGLFHHGWSFERNDNFGEVFWARGNSWFTYGILELFDVLGEAMEAPVREMIGHTFKAQIDSIISLQGANGLWHTILDDPDSYQEVSGSAGFAAGLYKALRLGLIEEHYLEYAQKALEGILANIDGNGNVLNVSAGTAIGLDAEHYKTIIIAPMPYGQSMALLALIEALEFYK